MQLLLNYVLNSRIFQSKTQKYRVAASVRDDSALAKTNISKKIKLPNNFSGKGKRIILRSSLRDSLEDQGLVLRTYTPGQHRLLCPEVWLILVFRVFNSLKSYQPVFRRKLKRIITFFKN